MASTTLVRMIADDPANVFNTLTTEEGFTFWWGPDNFPVISAAADLQVGGHFRVRFRTADGLEHECTGLFLEISKPERIVMRWRWSLGGEQLEQGAVSRLELQLWGDRRGYGTHSDPCGTQQRVFCPQPRKGVGRRIEETAAPI